MWVFFHVCGGPKKILDSHEQRSESSRLISIIDNAPPIEILVSPGKLRAYVNLDGGTGYRADAQDL